MQKVISFGRSKPTLALLGRLTLRPSPLGSYDLIAQLSNSSNVKSALTLSEQFKKRKQRLSFIDFNEAITAEEAVTNILYNTPSTEQNPVNRHVFNCLVTNEPGVLARVSGILAGRGFNIDSLVVSKTEVPLLSRMTIVLYGQLPVIIQARKQLEDLVPVYAVLDYTHAKIVERELLLVKVNTIPKDEHETPIASSITPLMASSLQRQTICELARLFNAKIADVGLDCMVLELCAKPQRIDSFIKLLKPYGIIEATRSGPMAMSRDPVDSFYSDFDEQVSKSDELVDSSMLPPG